MPSARVVWETLSPETIEFVQGALTPDQLQALKHLAAGASSSEIAERMDSDDGTVRSLLADSVIKIGRAMTMRRWSLSDAEMTPKP